MDIHERVKKTRELTPKLKSRHPIVRLLELEIRTLKEIKKVAKHPKNRTITTLSIKEFH